MAQNGAYRKAGLPQSLAAGQVANAAAVIFTATGPTEVSALIFYNTNAATQTLGVYVTRSGGTRRQLYQFSVAQYASVNVLSSGEKLHLSSGDTIDAGTTTSTAVDYTITGIVYA